MGESLCNNWSLYLYTIMHILYDWEVSPLNSAFNVALSGGDMQVMQLSSFGVSRRRLRVIESGFSDT